MMAILKLVKEIETLDQWFGEKESFVCRHCADY